MANEYRNVEISEEMITALDNPEAELETTESQEKADDTSATETTTEETTKTAEAEEVVTEPGVEDSGFIEINGEKYDKETVLKFKEDHDNKSSWQKSNTEKAQNLSKWSKLTDKINSDDEFRNHLKDYFFDNPEAIKSLGLDGEISIPVKEEDIIDIPDETDMRLRALETVEQGRIMDSRVDKLDQEMTNLENAYPELLEGEAGAEFLEFAEQNAARFSEDGMPNLERAFKEWSFGTMQEQLTHYKKLEQNSKRNTGVINTSEGGAKEVKTEKTRKTYKDFKVTDPDIAKYFNE